MKELVERIKNDGRVLGEGVLKVDSFITHRGSRINGGYG